MFATIRYNTDSLRFLLEINMSTYNYKIYFIIEVKLHN